MRGLGDATGVQQSRGKAGEGVDVVCVMVLEQDNEVGVLYRCLEDLIRNHARVSEFPVIDERIVVAQLGSSGQHVASHL